MNKTKKLVIVGAGEFGHIAYEYFTDDSVYEVVAFAVENKYYTKVKDEETGLPIVLYENVMNIYSPDQYEIFVAITFVKLNRPRHNLYIRCKELGYKCASYVSSHAYLGNHVEIGENTFIFENNTIQYHAKIGNNVVLWSGGNIGHRSVIHDDCWISYHVVLAGFCEVGSACFLGVNATIGDNVKIADDVILGAGAVTVKNLEQKAGVYIGNPAKPMNRTSYKQFGVEEK